MAALKMLVISCSMNPNSRSRLLARCAHAALQKLDAASTFVDLCDANLPLCDGAAAYGHTQVAPLAESIRTAHGVLLASPIYNYDLNSTAKTLVELTGKAWTGQVVGFLCAAGGRTSYMAPMGLANSLMLDFRSVIVPRFVYAAPDDFQNDAPGAAVIERIDELAREVVRMGAALRGSVQ